MSRFLESLHKATGTKLILSSAYHLQTNGTERNICSVEDLLTTCVLEKRDSWDSYLPFTEITYNNNFHSSIRITYFEVLYGVEFPFVGMNLVKVSC